MSFSVLLFSSLTAFADTTVDNLGNYDKQFFSEKVFNFSDSNFNLSELPIENYITVVKQEYDNNGKVATTVILIPSTNKKIEFVSQYPSQLSDDTIYLMFKPYIDNNLYFKTSFPYFVMSRAHIGGSGSGFSTNPTSISYHTDHNYSNNTFTDSEIIYNALKSKSYNYREYFSQIADCTGVNRIGYQPKLFNIVAQLVPGYTGEIVDKSVETLLENYGKTCDLSILKQYKYQITYFQNNDIKMMFLNNNKAPKYTVSDYEGVYPISRKYTFTYENSYDSIVYFPQYQKYLNYDDWYNNKPEPNDFKWFWETDNKSFSLINDWTVTFNDGAPNYSGTRVIIGWEKSHNAAIASMSDAWKIDKDKLINSGWIEGRPNDQNYPYQITLKQNGVPTFQIYMNSKPTIVIDRNNDYQCAYKVQMVPQYGYIYSFWADCYSKFDYTSRYSNGDDILSNVQNSVWSFWTEMLYMDDQYYLHLYENFRGSTEPESTDYIGYKVFFNWDISTDMINKNDNDDYDYSQLVNTGDKYVDENGNIHGGSLSNYDSDDLNKYNDNGSTNNAVTNGTLDFSYDGIYSYCSEFLGFIKAIFNIFPAFIWVLVGASITVLIALRVLGR